MTSLLPLMLLGGAFAAELTPEIEDFKPADALGLDQTLGVPVGTPIDDLSLLDLSGNKASLLGDSSTVLVIFYKGGWCPYCNGQLRDLAIHHDAFVARGVDLVAVSTDSPEATAITNATWEIPFRVLSDPEAKAVETFDVAERLNGMTRTMLKVVAGINQPAWRGSTDGKTALSGAFLVQDGVVTWRHVESALKIRPSATQLLDALPSSTQP